MSDTHHLCLALVLLAACHGELVPIDDPGGVEPAVDASPVSPTWRGDAAPRLASCTSCHGTAGRYSLETYAASLGGGSDAVPNVVAGDMTSALVAYCRRGHGGLAAADVTMIERWIADGARER